MPSFRVASGQRCFENEVLGSFSCSAFRVQESNMFSVRSFEYALGDCDGHLVLKAGDDDAFCWKEETFLQ